MDRTVKGTECHSVLATWFSSIERTQVHAWIPTGSVSISGRCPIGCIQTHGKAFIDITQSFEDAVRCTIAAIFFLACFSLALNKIQLPGCQSIGLHCSTHTHTHIHTIVFAHLGQLPVTSPLVAYPQGQGQQSGQLSHSFIPFLKFPLENQLSVHQKN